LLLDQAQPQAAWQMHCNAFADTTCLSAVLFYCCRSAQAGCINIGFNDVLKANCCGRTFNPVKSVCAQNDKVDNNCQREQEGSHANERTTRIKQ